MKSTIWKPVFKNKKLRPMRTKTWTPRGLFVWEKPGGDGLSATGLRGFYFLMAATAFMAASSRFSAAVMGRPLSVRILLASWTLVPGRHRKTLLQQATTQMTKTGLTRLNPICHLHRCKTTLCERQRVPLEESLHMMTDGRSYGWMVANSTADPKAAFTVNNVSQARGEFSCVCAPPSWSEVRGSRCWMIRWRPCAGRPATNQRERERDSRRHSPQLGGSTPWAGCLPALHMVQPNTSLKCLSQHRAGGARKLRRSGRQWREREWIKGSNGVKGQKPAVYVALSDFTHEDVMAKKRPLTESVWSGF